MAHSDSIVKNTSFPLAVLESRVQFRLLLIAKADNGELSCRNYPRKENSSRLHRLGNFRSFLGGNREGD